MNGFTCPFCAHHHPWFSNMAPTIESVYREIDQLVNGYHCREAYKKLEVVGELIADKAEWHRRCAEVCYMISNTAGSYQERVEWLKKGRKHALEAHDLNPTSIAILKILCSTTGRLAEESGLRDKINLGFEFKTHLDRAVAVDPSCFELLHMRGRFSYQALGKEARLYLNDGFDGTRKGFYLKVASLSFIERLVARTLGTLPQVSMDAALKDLLEAEQLRPGVTENMLYLGRVLYAKGDYAAAKKWLMEAANTTCDDDESVEREHIMAAREMLQWKAFQK